MPPLPIDDVLAAAELWRSEPPQMVAGREDAYPFCAAVGSTDVGLSFCRRCPEEVVRTAQATRRTADGRCGAGVRLLAFAIPPYDAAEVAVLRVAPPEARLAGGIAESVRVPAAALRRAARETPVADRRAVLHAARVFRSPVRRRDWQVAQRERSADRQRAASAALAQFIVATEEFQALYRNAVRQRGQLDRARRLADRLAREAVHVREHERARIAHQIHDTAAQSLVSALRYLEAAAAAPGTEWRGTDEPGVAPNPLDLAQERLRTAINELRAILGDLIPPGLELGLDQAIRYRHRDLLAEAGLTGSVTSGLPRLEPWVEQVIFGMVSEAMSNAARHAAGRTLSVEGKVVRGRLVVTVVDDGQGIPRTRDRARDLRGGSVPADGRGGLGLVGLLRQAHWLGGATRIRDRPGGGTAVRISVPLSRYLIEPASPSDGAPAGGPA